MDQEDRNEAKMEEIDRLEDIYRQNFTDLEARMEEVDFTQFMTDLGDFLDDVRASSPEEDSSSDEEEEEDGQPPVPVPLPLPLSFQIPIPPIQPSVYIKWMLVPEVYEDMNGTIWYWSHLYSRWILQEPSVGCFGDGYEYRESTKFEVCRCGQQVLAGHHCHWCLQTVEIPQNGVF